jgi:phosphate transport system ATP-binding protein
MPASSITALIGPSGCGKSTFLRILNRMHELVPGASLAGEITLNGVDIYGRDVRATDVRRRIGMVFQKPNPFPAMTISENVLSGPRLCGIKVPDEKQLVEDCLHRAGLWNEVKNRLSQPGGALSGGQQQRAFIARAFASEPDLLVLDEPVAGVDAESQRRFRDSLVHLVEEHGSGVLLVSHELSAVAHDIDRVVVLKRTVLFDGPPDELLAEGVSLGVHRDDLPLWLEGLR